MRLIDYLLKPLKWALVVLGGLFGILMFCLAVSGLFYRNWRSEQMDRLVAGSQVVETDAGAMEYSMSGDDGPLLLFVHGQPGGYDSAPAPRDGMRILTPSRPGYLRTPLATGSSPAEQAKAFAALLDTLGIDEPVLVQAASAGGPAAISFAAMYPERTAGLILAEVVSQRTEEAAEVLYPFFMQNDYLFWLVFGSIETFMSTESMLGFMLAGSENLDLLLQNPEQAEEMAALVWKMWPLSQRIAGARNDEIAFTELNLPISSIEVPTFIIHGDADSNVPFSDSEKLAAALPHAGFHVVKGGDHWMPWTHKAEVAGAIENFIQHTLRTQ